MNIRIQTLTIVAVFLSACGGVSAGMLNSHEGAGCVKGSFSRVCSGDGKAVLFCYKSGQTAVLEDCPKADCKIGDFGYAQCASSTGRKHGIGPHECSEVKDGGEGAFVCSQTYDELFQCLKSQKSSAGKCGKGCCTSTVDSGSCPPSC
ncbi:hypothetical protein AC579_6153 [Pseudocercospora musae]|uniref:Cyanovirin-N domain-containing protein n=1 Tax=Pseudocercospora musae TaxID=113226 RepID=A0A139I4T4_9PEZI|nr:hypothetical protein AC579_6153 [Pseudocercospora musae]